VQRDLDFVTDHGAACFDCLVRGEFETRPYTLEMFSPA
jgi:hypothetical protein